VVRPIVEGVRNRYPVAVAETGHQDRWQRAELGVATVSGSARLAREIIDEVERFIWSFPEIEVLDTRLVWMEEE
jgi:uncharacterized protein